MGTCRANIRMIRMNPITSILVLCTSASYGSILPLKFDFGNNKPIDFSVKQCDGHEDDPLVLVSGTMEEELCMPGSTTMNTVTRMREDLPTDLMVQLNLQKITPFPMTVPCLEAVSMISARFLTMQEILSVQTSHQVSPAAAHSWRGKLRSMGFRFRLTIWVMFLVLLWRDPMKLLLISMVQATQIEQLDVLHFLSH